MEDLAGLGLDADVVIEGFGAGGFDEEALFGGAIAERFRRKIDEFVEDFFGVGSKIRMLGLLMSWF